MREQEVNSRVALAEFNDILIRIRSFESRYKKDCITDEEMAKQIQDLRQVFNEKAKEMTSLFKNPFFKDNFVPNLVAKYKQKFEYNPEEVFVYLDQLYADFASLYQRSCQLFLDDWSEANDAEAEKKIKAQLEMLDNIIKTLDQRNKNTKMKQAQQDEKAEKAAERARKAEEEKKKKAAEAEEEKPEEEKKQKGKKGKGSKKVKGVILKPAPRGGSKIYYVKNSETREKEAAAQREAKREMSKPAHQPALSPRQMSR